jgi:hypothetical protein
MGGASVVKQWSCTARVIKIYFLCGLCRRRELIVAVAKEGKSKIISRSNSGVLTWPTTAVVKISPVELPLLLPCLMPGQEALYRECH